MVSLGYDSRGARASLSRSARLHFRRFPSRPIKALEGADFGLFPVALVALGVGASAQMTLA